MIDKVAYLQLCMECRQHAHVVLPDGNNSHIFATKTDGRAQVDLLLANGQIRSDEATVLKSQINATKLPEKDELISDIVEFINGIHDEMLSDEAKAPRTLH